LKLGNGEFHRSTSPGVYHELVPLPVRSFVPSPAQRWWALAGLALSLALGCGDAHWHTLRWPSSDPGAPPQPASEAIEPGLGLSATQIDYEPEAVIVALVLANRGPERVRIERVAILLAWDELEYPADADPHAPAWIELEPGARASIKLRYHLGHPLTGSGARLLLRSVTMGERALVELPELALPGKPV
jgi:hypothetical protein